MSDARPEAPTDHTGLTILDLDECLRRLRSAQVGRLAFVLDGEVCVLPVVHVVEGSDVCFRTAGNSKIEAAINHERVAFQADQYDGQLWTGWSVLVQGTIEVIDDPALVHRLEQLGPPSWIAANTPTREYTWVRVRPHAVSGRELTLP